MPEPLPDLQHTAACSGRGESYELTVPVDGLARVMRCLDCPARAVVVLREPTEVPPEPVPLMPWHGTRWRSMVRRAYQ